MSLSLKDYMECVSLSLTGKPLDFCAFSRRVLDNGGYDMHEISVGDIANLYNEEFSNCNRDEVLWAFAETINMYKKKIADFHDLSAIRNICRGGGCRQPPGKSDHKKRRYSHSGRLGWVNVK